MKKKIITRFDNKPYLIRWTLFNLGFISCKVHKIILSDDSCLHDHPWAFISIILRGGYVEERVVKWMSLESFRKVDLNSSFSTKYQYPNKLIFDIDNPGLGDRVGLVEKRIYGVGSILYRKANDTHRLEVFTQPALTLVFTFKKTRMWGFFTNLGWLPWFKYNQENSCD
jgi:hypothetical protein